MSVPYETVYDPSVTYHDLTFHAVAVIQQLQQPWERTVRIGRAGGTVIERPAPLRAVTPRLGVEVGTHRGKNAASMLARMPNLHLSMVDPYDGKPNESPFFTEALAETVFATDRRKFVFEWSPDAARGFADHSLDFAFIDGDHSYPCALADFFAWWPKVKDGGWLFGHDFNHPREKDLGWGVTEAAEEFCRQVDRCMVVYEPRAMTFGVQK